MYINCSRDGTHLSAAVRAHETLLHDGCWLLDDNDRAAAAVSSTAPAPASAAVATTSAPAASAVWYTTSAVRHAASVTSSVSWHVPFGAVVVSWGMERTCDCGFQDESGKKQLQYNVSMEPFQFPS